MKKLIAALPCLQKLYIDAMQCTWNIYCLSEIMQWISVAKELQFLTFKMRSDQGKYGFEQVIFYLRHSNFYQLTQDMWTDLTRIYLNDTCFVQKSGLQIPALDGEIFKFFIKFSR